MNRYDFSNKIRMAIVGILLISTVTDTYATDNPKPSSWRNIDIKITETYGNNQTRPLRGAKVIVDLVNKDQSSDFKTRFPKTKTSGPRGASFTRMPPSSIVGDYIVTVIPKPSDKQNKFSCKQKQMTFIHNTTKANKQFRFQCLQNSSTNTIDAISNIQDVSLVNNCHKVKIQKQEGSRKTAYSKACLQADESWEIEKFKY